MHIVYNFIIFMQIEGYQNFFEDRPETPLFYRMIKKYKKKLFRRIEI